jgi:diketogulonate reductase-like aldo/keto reductase
MTIPLATLPDQTTKPRFGVGTWNMGERASSAAQEVEALQAAIERGVTLIDTAEMYADGGAERIIAQAIANAARAANTSAASVRERLYIVSKVYPHNASKKGIPAACERSLKRLGTDYIDCYLLHWRGEHPLQETVDAFEALKAEGKIRAWGVSNFDTDDMRELVAVSGGANVVTNQVLYNLSRRGVEFDLLPWQRERGITTMAYSPIEQARLLSSSKLQAIARDVGATPAQLAIAWLMREPDVIVIPKTSHVDRLQENLGALELKLDGDTLSALDDAFPPPKRRSPLQML